MLPLKTFLLLILITLCSAQMSYAQNPTIRYSSIIYFFPDTQVNQIEISQQLSFFTQAQSLPKNTSKPLAILSLVNDFNTYFPVPKHSYLSYFGRGIAKKSAQDIQDTKQALVVDIAFPREQALTANKAMVHFLHKVANTYPGLIWDSETRELFSPNKWHEQRISPWQDTYPEVSQHNVIHAYKSGTGVRAITLGMAKFGLPDIVINNFSWSLNRSMGNLINLTAQTLLEAPTALNGNRVSINIDKLKNLPFKQTLLASLKENANTKTELEIKDAQWEEGDPDNHLIEILFSHAQGNSLSEQQESLLSHLYGWEDSISYVKHNSLILEASARAKKKLNNLAKAFNAGLAPGEFIQVKAPFTTPDGANEWMWVEILSWQGNNIRGILKNEPYHIPNLKSGSEVLVKQNKVFDYIRSYPDRESEGNETGPLILKSQQQ